MNYSGSNSAYFFDRDESGHWYMISMAHREEWLKWVEGEQEDDPPSFAKFIDSPSDYCFSDVEVI